jgi:peroxiredoxin
VASERRFAGPFVALFVALAVGWLMLPNDQPPLRLPTRNLPAPHFSLPGPDSTQIALTNFAGRIVVLNFWATFCPPCIREMPALNRLHLAQSTNGVVVVGLSADTDPPAVVPDFVRRNGIQFPVAYADTTTLEAYGVTSLPQTFVIGPDGRMATRLIGRVRESDLLPVIETLRTNRPVN